jgi:pimeloyl-ACP methyl ester carboxylesterase
MIIHGDRDPFFPVSIPVEAYQAIPDAYLWIVPNGGHLPLMGSAQDRSYLIQQVLAFFGEG